MIGRTARHLLRRLSRRGKGGFRCGWLARLTNGRIGLGRWTQAEVDRINAAAKAKAAEFEKWID